MSEPEAVLRVVRGRPTPEELAALVVVLRAQAPVAAPAPRPPASGWTDRARAIGAPPAPGPGAWQASVRWS